MTVATIDVDLADEALTAAETVLGRSVDRDAPVQVLQPVRRRSAVLLVGPGGGVVVKRASTASVQVEQTVYDDLLPAGGVPHVRCRGTVPAREPGYAWLVTDHADGRPFDTRRAPDRTCLGTWLSAVHAAAVDVPQLTPLPDRRGALQLALVVTAATVIRDGLSNPALSAEERGVLVDMAAILDRVQAVWLDVDELLATTPPTLIHGDLVAKNVLVGRHAGAATPWVLDWGAAGRGSIATDLLAVDLAAYLRQGRSVWPWVTMSDLQRLRAVGLLLWTAFVLGEEGASLSSGWPHRSVRKVAAYLDALNRTDVDTMLHVRRRARRRD